MWTDITNSKILATQTGLWLTWVLKVYICCLRQLSVAKTHLQQFRYLSILKLWKLTKDLCIKLGSPASEHPAQIFFRIVVHEILILAEPLIFEFKFCPFWLARISERIWWVNIPFDPTCASVEEFLIPEIYGSFWRHRRYLLGLQMWVITPIESLMDFITARWSVPVIIICLASGERSISLSLIHCAHYIWQLISGRMRHNTCRHTHHKRNNGFQKLRKKNQRKEKFTALKDGYTQTGHSWH